MIAGRFTVPAMNTPDNPAAGILGRLLDVEVEDELAHYYLCPTCGQAVDARELDEVLHHETDGHDPFLTH